MKVISVWIGYCCNHHTVHVTGLLDDFGTNYFSDSIKFRLGICSGSSIMKKMKVYMIFLVILLIIGVYLIVGYTGFYSFIGVVNLRPPVHSESTVINGSKDTPIKFVTLGDSLSDGVGVSNYGKSFPYILAEKLANGQSVELINLAHAGDTTNEVINNQLARAVEAKPKIVTILVGVNDIHRRIGGGNFEKNYTKIVGAMAATGAKVYCMSLPYLGSEKIVRFPYNLALDWQTRSLNTIIKKIADQEECQFIDLYQKSKSANFYSSDLFHPSEIGYKEWLEAF